MKRHERVGSTVECVLEDGRVVAATIVGWVSDRFSPATKGKAKYAVIDIGDRPIDHSARTSGDDVEWVEKSAGVIDDAVGLEG